MNRMFFIVFIVFILAGVSSGAERTVEFGRFGKVTVYYQSPLPSHVVLFVSGDGGWNKGVVDMARELASLDALVAGIDITHYLRELERSSEKCSYPAADFELLSKFLQKKMDFPVYVPPVLVGYSSGATLVYALLAQAPPDTFRGAISMGFCPDLPLVKPLCKGKGLEWKRGARGKGYIFLEARHLMNPWIAFEGEIDQVCNTEEMKKYVQGVNFGEIVLLPKVGHGFSVPRNWMPQFRNAFRRIVETTPAREPAGSASLKGLPLVEVHATGPETSYLAVIVSGDGGWAGIDRDIGNSLAADGVPVVGFNSLQYFWKKRTPEETANDISAVIQNYLSAWQKSKVLLIGYSLGADVLPFIVNRLQPEILQKVRLVILLGPGHDADFEFHIGEWVGLTYGATLRPVLPEAEKMREMRVLCFYGEEERDSICKSLKGGFARSISMKGGHHFGGAYGEITEIILKEMK
jgi:type IV secretory pathway VirJ component